MNCALTPTFWLRQAGPRSEDKQPGETRPGLEPMVGRLGYHPNNTSLTKTFTPLQNPRDLLAATATNITHATNSTAATSGRNHTSSATAPKIKTTASHQARVRLRRFGVMSSFSPTPELSGGGLLSNESTEA